MYIAGLYSHSSCVTFSIFHLSEISLNFQAYRFSLCTNLRAFILFSILSQKQTPRPLKPSNRYGGIIQLPKSYLHFMDGSRTKTAKSLDNFNSATSSSLCFYISESESTVDFGLEKKKLTRILNGINIVRLSV